MSESTPPAPPPTPPTPPASAPAKTKKPRRWRRRLGIGLIAAILLALIFRVILTFLLPSVMNKVAAAYRLKCTYDRLDLSITGGNADIWNLKLLPIDGAANGGDPVVQADYCQGDISVWNLLKGRLVIYRAAADGVELDVDRNADGRIPLLERFVPQTTASGAPATPNAAATSTYSLAPPLRIDALRLEHIRAHFLDHAVTPAVDARLALDLRLNNLGNPGQPTRFELDFSSDPVLDALQIDGRSVGDANNLTATIHVMMRGLHLKPAAGYLAALGLRPIADDISGTVSGQITASVAPNPRDGIQATLTLSGAKLMCDRANAAAVDSILVNVDSLTPEQIKIGTVTVDGVNCLAGRQADGSPSAAGLALSPSTKQAHPTPPPPNPFVWSVGQLAVTNVQCGFVDESVSPQVRLSLHAPRVQLDNVVCDPNQPNATAQLAATFALPGLVRQVQVHGTLSPFTAEKQFKIAADATGVAPSAVDPYLDLLGLSSEWKNGEIKFAAEGSLSLDTSGKMAASAHLTNFKIADGSDLLDFKDAQIKGASLDPVTRTLHADSIAITGPDLSLRRDADGHLHAMAFKLNGSASSPAHSSSPAPAVNPSAPIPIDTIEMGHFAWTGVHLHLTDEAVAPASRLAISDAGVIVDDLTIRRHPGKSPAKPGKIHAWIVVPNIVSNLTLDGTITAEGDRSTCDYQIAGDGLHAQSLAAYLTPLGIAPTVQSGSLNLRGQLQYNPAGLSATCDDLKYTDGSQTLLSVGHAQLDGLQCASGNIALTNLAVTSPWARIVRHADGSLETAGIRLLPQAPPTASADPPTTQPSGAPFTASVASLAISDAGIEWVDQTAQPAVQTTLHADAGLTNFAFGPHTQPARMHAHLRTDGCVDSLNLDGSLDLSAAAQNAQLTIDASGLRAGPLSAYLPTGVKPTLQNGSFHAELNAAVAPSPKGGRSIDLTLKNLLYTDAGQTLPFLKLDTFHLIAPRLDPQAMRLELSDLSLDGLEVNASKTPGGLDLLGLEMTSQPAAPDPAPTTQPSAPPSMLSTAATAASSPQDVLRQIAAARAKLPYVTLQKLNLNIRRIGLTDAAQPAAAPLVISGLAIHNNAPIALLGTDPESNPPAEFQITGQAAPVADAFMANVKVTPFARQKIVAVDLTVTGIHGQGISSLAPQWSAYIDPSGLTQGQFTAKFMASVQLKTVRPTDFNFNYGGKLDLNARDIAFRAQPGGPILAGVGEIHADGATFQPNFTAVDVRSLEIDDITARAARQKDGIHVLGLVLRMPAPATRPSVASAPPAPAPSHAASPPPPPALPSHIITLEQLAVSGADIQVEDQTCNPPVILPISGLDVTVDGLTNLALYQHKVIRFSILATAGDVPLPRLQPTDAPNRELFSQVDISGAGSLYPYLRGWAKTSISGFELLGVRGVAKQFDVTIGGGTFDGDFDWRYPGDETLDTTNRLVFTDLSMSERSGGIVQKKLKLGGPLDGTIHALEDQDGSITIPINFHIEKGNLDTGSVLASGIGAMGSVITAAIAGKVADLFGLGGKPADLHPVVLTFPPGYSELLRGDTAKLEALERRMHDDPTLTVVLRSDNGKGDVALAAQRLNPSPADARALADELSVRRDALLEAQRDMTAQIQALFAAGNGALASAAIERLRDIDRQLYQTENSMDSAYDLLRPGSQKQALTRTRAAALAIVMARIQAAVDVLRGPGGEISAGRIKNNKPVFTATPSSDDGMLTITLVKKK